MSGAVLLGFLWALVGMLLGYRWRSERAKSLHNDAPVPGPNSRRFGQVRLGGSQQRVQTMLGAYAAGAALVSVGFLIHTPWLLGPGAMLVNVGTIYRYLVVALDASTLDGPVVTRTASASRAGASRHPIRAFGRNLLGDVSG